jgi:hypothetical protein
MELGSVTLKINNQHTPVRYGTRLGDLKENRFIQLNTQHTPHGTKPNQVFSHLHVLKANEAVHGREGGREEGRKGGREGGRAGGRAGGREGGREGA